MRSYEGSRTQFTEAQRYLAGGVSSSIRAAMRPTPLFVQSAAGPRVRDVDGNEYLDYLLGYGPLILGHAHPAVVEQTTRALRNGALYGLQHAAEAQLARMLIELVPCAERAAFSDSGTTAVMLALRLARAATGRQKIVRFHGHYHGWADTIFTAFPSVDIAAANAPSDQNQVLPGTGGQSSASLSDILLLPWNDLPALEQTLATQQHEIAAVISEPVMCNSGCLMPASGYLAAMRALCSQYGIVLIFDEVITGFRVGLGGAQQRFGVTPDLATLAKAIGGGFALSAVVGKAAIMDQIATGTVSHLGSLNGNCVALAGGLATLAELARNDGAAYAQLEQAGEYLTSGLQALFAAAGVPAVINGIGPVFHLMLTNQPIVNDFAGFLRRDAQGYAQLAAALLDEGVLVRPSGLWYISTAHTPADLDATIAAMERALHQTVRA